MKHNKEKKKINKNIFIFHMCRKPLIYLKLEYQTHSKQNKGKRNKTKQKYKTKQKQKKNTFTFHMSCGRMFARVSLPKAHHSEQNKI